jgi:hypothetical protein
MRRGLTRRISSSRRRLPRLHIFITYCARFIIAALIVSVDTAAMLEIYAAAFEI